MKPKIRTHKTVHLKVKADQGLIWNGGLGKIFSVFCIFLHAKSLLVSGQNIRKKKAKPSKCCHAQSCIIISVCPSSISITVISQKNLHQMKVIINSPSPPIGPYCLSNNSQLILTAACLYFLLSSLSRELTSPILSRLSPRYSKSSMFFVMTFVTSLSSSFSLSRFCVARVSEYVDFVRWMKVSNSMKA